MAGQSIERREVLRILAMASGAARFPGFVRWRFGCGHLRSAEAIAPTAYKPIFFSPSEYALIEHLTDIIIPSDTTPGAREAGVAEFIDFFVAHDASVQYRFRTGITWLNAHAERLHSTAFLALSSELQTELLEPLAYKAKQRAGEEDGREFFHLVRRFTVMGFYTSEIGFKELDHPALKLYTQSPECPHKNDPEHRNATASAAAAGTP